jgi:hypothetical protein
METTFLCFEFLPTHIKQGIHITSCRHIVNVLMSELASIKKFNILSIFNLNLDLRGFEDFVKKSKIPNLMENFSELRQLINLLLSGNIEEILDKPTREAKYFYLSNEKLIQFLDKFKEPDSKAVVPDSLPKLKRKAIDIVIKRLKN